ncbi:acetylxylan esterase [Tautonia sociabilis]|uniref:Acetylxylan esterase n=1 Tax=Tautonia sociabilis TaxID=2080755 RepID=A0A432MJI7_9BACT|nr:acetylxylan esterase [Tautonia sociabilis]
MLAAAVLSASPRAEAQPAGANYDESKVPDYTLPDPLVAEDGTRVMSPEQWRDVRRPEILRLFSELMYGKTPGGRPERMRWEVVDSSDDALDGLATRKQIRIFFDGRDDGPRMDLLLYTPAAAEGPVPTFLGLNFRGNHTVFPDPAILLPDGADEADRGERRGRWPIDVILRNGFGVATAWYFDIDPDVKDQWSDGVHPIFYAEGQDRPLPDEWGAIGAWAWGLSRAMDYLEADEDVDGSRVIVLGHSRLGKTSLWAGAQDERFALVISNDSGCGGAALSRRRFGETVERINTTFPHWFSDSFNQFNANEDSLPFDQHMLIALIAPRPVLVCSAEEDLWADPRGEFLSAKHAGPVYRLLGADDLGVDEMPPVNTLVGGTIGYHIRPGAHDVTLRDWDVFMEFATLRLGRAARR